MRMPMQHSHLDALSFCMPLPGPEAMQLATYVGWRMHRLKGGLAAGLLFVRLAPSWCSRSP
jgi:chromate transporter